MVRYIDNEMLEKVKEYRDKWSTEEGAENFFRILPRTSKCLQHLLKIIQEKLKDSAAEDFVRLLKEGKFYLGQLLA
jgi:hypothetical protein